MAVSKPRLSREYLYVPFEDMNMDPSELVVNALAFMTASAEPEEADWVTGIVVESTDPLYVTSIGEGIALLIGPDRGDAVTTEDLANGVYQVWVDASITGSDERIVRIAGVLTVSVTGA